jgi:hypothetical protein
LVTIASASSEPDPDKLYEPILWNSVVSYHFKLRAIPGEPYNEGIVIVKKNSEAKQEERMFWLPYLTTSGEISAAFLMDFTFDGKKELVVLQRVVIRSDTGMPYASDFYIVTVFDIAANGSISKNTRLTTYFGEGADVYASRDSDEIVYRFPYKTQSMIEAEIDRGWYSTWYRNAWSAVTLAEKVNLSSDRIIDTFTDDVVLAGDFVGLVGVEGGWLDVFYVNRVGERRQGWLKCQDVLECRKEL